MAEAWTPAATAPPPAVSEAAFVKELVKDPKKDWYTMGCLLGLYEHTVKDIMIKHCLTGGIEGCLREIYKALQKQSIQLTWEKIIDALSTAAMNNKAPLAEEINQKYCGGSYRSPHGTDEEEKRDKMIADFLMKVCMAREEDNPKCVCDKDGFCLVQDILERYNNEVKDLHITHDDVRRVTAWTPELKLDKNKKGDMKIRAKSGSATARSQSKLYHFMSTICRFGDNEIPPDANDGSVNVKTLLTLVKWQEYDVEDAKKAVRYSNKDELILINRRSSDPRIKHITIHPPLVRPEDKKKKQLWSNVRSCCVKAGDKDIPYDEEGYIKVSEIVKYLKIKRKDYKNVTEQEVVEVVRTTPPNCEQEWLMLNEECPTLKVKAKWGHNKTMDKVERPYTNPRLTVDDKIPPFVCHMICRKYWVEHKTVRGLLPTHRYRIELQYKDQPLENEEDILKEYGHHQVIVEIDLEKAIKDGLEFHRQPPRIIICMEESIPEKYIKNIL